MVAVALTSANMLRSCSALVTELTTTARGLSRTLAFRSPTETQMKLRRKLLTAFLAISVLVAVMSALAFKQQVTGAKQAAIREAENVANTMAGAMAFDPPGDAQPLFYDRGALQEYVQLNHRKQHRDIAVLDNQRRTLADAVPSEIGEPFPDSHGIVAETIRDGIPRTFMETDD